MIFIFDFLTCTKVTYPFISAKRDDLYSLRTSIRSICIWNSLKVKLITFLRVWLHALSLFRNVLRKFFLWQIYVTSKIEKRFWEKEPFGDDRKRKWNLVKKIKNQTNENHGMLELNRDVFCYRKLRNISCLQRFERLSAWISHRLLVFSK